MASQIHVGDIGTTLIVNILEDGSVVDISSASSLQIIIKKPDATTLTKQAYLQQMVQMEKCNMFLLQEILTNLEIIEFKEKLI